MEPNTNSRHQGPTPNRLRPNSLKTSTEHSFADNNSCEIIQHFPTVMNFTSQIHNNFCRDIDYMNPMTRQQQQAKNTELFHKALTGNADEREKAKDEILDQNLNSEFQEYKRRAQEESARRPQDAAVTATATETGRGRGKRSGSESKQTGKSPRYSEISTPTSSRSSLSPDTKDDVSGDPVYKKCLQIFKQLANAMPQAPSIANFPLLKQVLPEMQHRHAVHLAFHYQMSIIRWGEEMGRLSPKCDQELYVQAIHRVFGVQSGLHSHYPPPLELGAFRIYPQLGHHFMQFVTELRTLRAAPGAPQVALYDDRDMFDRHKKFNLDFSRTHTREDPSPARTEMHQIFWKIFLDPLFNPLRPQRTGIGEPQNTS